MPHRTEPPPQGRSSSRKLEIMLGVILGVLAGFLAGVFTGSAFAPDSPESKIAASPAANSASLTHSIESPRTGIPTWIGDDSDTTENTIAITSGDPAVVKAVNEALQAPSPFDLARMLLLVDTLPKEHFPTVLEILRKRKSSLNSGSLSNQGPPFWVAFWLRFGEADPETAFAKALECTDLQYAERAKLPKHLLHGMANRDPAKAAALLAANPDLPNRINAVEGLIFSWGRKDIQAATAWANQHLENAELKRAFYALGWSVNDQGNLSQGLGLIKAQGPGPARDALFSALKDQATQTPGVPVPQILDFVTATRDIGTNDPGLEQQLIVRCAKSDPLAAAEYTIQPRADGKPVDAGMLGVIARDWAGRDSKAAESWAKGHEGKPGYTAVARALAFAAEARGDHEAAKVWIGKSEQ